MLTDTQYRKLKLNSFGFISFRPAIVAIKMQRWIALVSFYLSVIFFMLVVATTYTTPAMLWVDDALMLARSHSYPIYNHFLFVLFSFALSGRSVFRKQSMKYLIFLCVGLLFVTLRVLEITIFPYVIASYTPYASVNGLENYELVTAFVSQIFADNAASFEAMPLMTTLVLYFIGAGALLRRSYVLGGFLCTFMGGVLFGIIALDFVDHNTVSQKFSFSTVIILFFLLLTEFLKYVRFRFLRSLASTALWGRIARMQIIIMLLSSVLIHMLTGIFISDHTSRVGIAILCMATISICLTLLVSNILEQSEKERRRLERRLQRQALYDDLTGALNRRGLQKKMDSHRVSEITAMMLIDVDHFKTINDEYGHPIGDKILEHLSQIIAKHTKYTDFVCRWGGDEFLVIMPGCASQDAIALAHNIKDDVHKMTRPEGLPSDYRVTLSIGITSYIKSFKKAVTVADQAMYDVKQAGRNDVKFIERLPV